MSADDLDDLGGEDTPPAASLSRNLLQVLWERRSLVLLGGAVGLVLGLLFYAQKPPVYQSAAQVLVVKKRSDALPIAGGDPRLSFYEDYVSTHMVLIRSPLVVQHAVRKRDLASLSSFAGQGDPTGAVLAGLTAGRDVPKDGSSAPNNIINLSYRGGDANDTGVVLAAVIDSYREFLDETYHNVSANTLDLITRARDLLKKDIAEKEKKYKEFRTKSPLLWKGSDGSNIHIGRIREFQVKQTALLARGGEIRERLAAIDKAKKGGSSQTVLLALATRPLDKAAKDSKLEFDLEQRLFPLLLEEKALLENYGEAHPKVIRVREQIAMTKQLFERLDGINKKASAGAQMRDRRLEQHIDALRQELALVETAQAGLARLLAEEEGKARALERYEIEDAAFRADIARTTRVLDETLKRLEQINLVRDFGGYEARAISEPGPGAKVSPVAWQLLAGGAMLGLLLGIGLAYLFDAADKSFRTPEEIRRRLRLPLVGHIPYLSHLGEPVAVAGPDGEPALLDAALVTLHRHASTEAEAFRSVRTALYFNTHGERHKVIQVTSPSMGDGKSTLVANLAVAIAQSGRKVLLVDADLRRPRAHRLFGLAARAGLAQVIGGAADLADTVRPTAVPGLFVLPCGPRPAHPAELLTLPAFADVLEELRDSYDYVLVDTPPLLAVSDPCAVAPRVDGVLLTLRVSKNGRPAAERARALLAGLRVHVFGVVVNGVGKQGAMSGYGYEHYQYATDYAAEYTSTSADAEPTPTPPATVSRSLVAVNGTPTNGTAVPHQTNGTAR
jgi:capsular exopolysaccharide synthesis family protein